MDKVLFVFYAVFLLMYEDPSQLKQLILSSPLQVPSSARDVHDARHLTLPHHPRNPMFGTSTEDGVERSLPGEVVVKRGYG